MLDHGWELAGKERPICVDRVPREKRLLWNRDVAADVGKQLSCGRLDRGGGFQDAGG